MQRWMWRERETSGEEGCREEGRVREEREGGGRGGKEKRKSTYTSPVGLCQRSTGANQKSSQWPNLEQFKEQSKIVLANNPKYKISITQSQSKSLKKFLVEIDRLILKFMWKCNGPRYPKQFWMKLFYTTGFQDFLYGYNNQIVSNTALLTIATILYKKHF